MPMMNPLMGGMMMRGMPQYPYYPAMPMGFPAKPVKYRTEPCRNFHSSNGCTYGDNCHFIHDFNYAGKPIPDLDAWRKSNDTRRQNINAMRYPNMGVGGMPGYYPPAPEPHGSGYNPGD